LRKGYIVQWGQADAPSVRVRHSRSGYVWESQGASWALRYIRGLTGRGVLARNGQPLAAIQLQGRLLSTWSEIIYDGQGYRLSSCQEQPDCFALMDQAGDEVLSAQNGDSLQIVLRRALPLALLVMVAMGIADEMRSTERTRRSAQAVSESAME
jgi:hypothetical protein